MDIKENLLSYLGKITGETLALTGMPDSPCTGIPMFYMNTYDFCCLKWLGQTILLALEKNDTGAAPSEYSRQMQFLSEHWHQSVVLVLPHLDSYKRNRLVQYGVPFIVPEQQCFLPPFADFRERFPRPLIEVGEHFSSSAQLTILYRLFNHEIEQYSLRELATIFGYSAMTMSNVARELVCAGLINGGKEKCRRLKFSVTGQELWRQVKPRLASPVIKKLWIKWQAEIPPLPHAGINALADYSMIADDPKPCWGCHKTYLTNLLKKGVGIEVKGADVADGLIEVWKYAPDILSDNNRVDRLSLFLSLENSGDERVQAELNHLLEDMSW